MVTVTAGSDGLDMRTLNFSLITKGYYINATSQAYVVRVEVRPPEGGYHSADIALAGSNFTYKAGGHLVGGSVTDFTARGSLVDDFQIRNFAPIAASVIMKASATASLSDDNALLAKIFVGNDVMTGNSGADYFRGYDGKDQLFGLQGNDVLVGGNGNDKLYGERGNDKLLGGAENDLLNGFEGTDIMTGGTGADAFVFTSKAASNAYYGYDTITDFSHAEGDRMDLRDIDKFSGDTIFRFIGKAAFTGSKMDLRYSVGASDTYVYGDTNGDRVADFRIHLDDAVTLVKGDFLL